MRDRALRRAPGYLALAIVLLAAAIRLYRLGARSLWLDEIVSVYPVRFATWDELAAHLQIWWDNMPLAFVITWLLRGLGGDEGMVRLPFAVAGTLAVGGLYGLGRDLGGSRIGLGAALLGALAPFLIWYSQEARPYAFLLLFTTCTMWAAYRAVTTGHLAAWTALPVCLALDLYTGYLALPLVAATAAFVGLSLLADLVGFLRTPRPRPAAVARQVRRQYTAAIGAALALGAAYFLPWWSHLRAFLDNNEVATIGLAAPHSATVAEGLDLVMALAALPPLLVYQLLALALLCLGWVCAGLWRGPARPALLLLCWLLVPLVALWTQLHGRIVQIQPRYVITLYPAAILLTVFGVAGLTRAGARLAARMVARWPGNVARSFLPVGERLVYAGLVLILIGQAVPALVAQQAVGKDDYRGAVAYVAAHSPAGAVILATGGPILFFPESFAYYTWLLRVPVLAVDGSRLDLAAAQTLAQGPREVWLTAPVWRDPDGAARAVAAGLEMRTFGTFALLHVSAPDVPPARQAQMLLGWAAATDPGSGSALDLATAVTHPPPSDRGLAAAPATAAPPAPGIYGPNGNEPAEQWMLWGSSSVLPAGQGFSLQPGGGEINVTLRTRQARVTQTYLLAFDYRNRDLVGQQRVYVSTHSADGRWLTTFPAGAGFPCPPAADWTTQGFAFTVPPDTDSTLLWFRANGTGSAEVRNIRLQPVP